MVEAARSVGIPTFENHNGRMMEGDGGASIIDLIVRDGKRLSVFRTYAFPYMDRPNLTVLTHALVTKLVLERKRVTGVEIAYDGKTLRINAGLEVIMSLGAINTPKLLMVSGIGDQAEQRLGIPLVQHLPGLGRTFRIILVSAASGSISNPSLLATMAAKQRFSGRAIPTSTLPICRPAWWKLRCAVPRLLRSSIHRMLAGPYLEAT
jgi:choline dehydrogenase-like flavoprotein